jgi:hypothetical protein
MASSHRLKTWPDPFGAIRNGSKRFEYRWADRPFAVGDWLILEEWDPGDLRYTGESEIVLVTYIARGPAFDIPYGFAVMSIVRDGPPASSAAKMLPIIRRHYAEIHSSAISNRVDRDAGSLLQELLGALHGE